MASSAVVVGRADVSTAPRCPPGRSSVNVVGSRSVEGSRSPHNGNARRQLQQQLLKEDSGEQRSPPSARSVVRRRWARGPRSTPSDRTLVEDALRNRTQETWRLVYIDG